MRLFIGVEIDARVRAAAADVAERLRQRLQRIDPQFTARWVPAENMHLTIWFIGEAPDERARQTVEALEAPFAAAAFELALGGCGAFPPSGPPRVCWIGMRDGQAAMQALHSDVQERMQRLGYQPERRPYTAHLTVARVKETGRGTAPAMRQALVELPAECGSCQISAVTLFRSRLSPRGAAYEPLLRVPLS